ncbi:GDSL esterase/lipase 5-like isoform X2 [Cucurbita pepo subsp. pepo]|uniref:GDSL esterase/lipase 5-like isoform X2 n=1 Tax=Cucurbita pepo subsp. pepo TaxID=3664 RepID=UPI000C9D4508|nr:GDSL esterase/lipase 5-like isoform X2 [Cucurbita pepo subsp. pepo]
MNTSNFPFFFSIFFTVFFIARSSRIADVYSLPKHVALFVFGDSFFDSGNNNFLNTTKGYRANFMPYGETFFKYPTGRFSNGRLVPDFIAEYANLPLIPSYLDPRTKRYNYGVNFASGGGGVLVETHRGFVIDLGTQLRYFKKVERSIRKKLGRCRARNIQERRKKICGCSGGSNRLYAKHESEDREAVWKVLG